MEENNVEKYQDYTLRGRFKSRISLVNVKLLLAVIGTELSMSLFAFYKGVGLQYFPIAVVMLIFTFLSYVVTYGMNADRVILIVMLILLNFGFLVQQIEMGQEGQIGKIIIKLLIAFFVAAITKVFYRWISRWFEKDYMIVIMSLTQIVICLGMVFLGTTIGSGAGQGTISFAGITPFELVKILYIFTTTGLLCTDKTKLSIPGIRKAAADREILLAIHTAILSLCMVVCSELGSLLMIYITGLLLLLIFGKHRIAIYILTGLTVIGAGSFWGICSFLITQIDLFERWIPGIFLKLIQRFGSASFPERYMQSFGFQGTRSLQAISMGGWFGIPTERYRVSIPEATNDFIFSNLVQTCGLMIAFILILLLIMFLKRGMDIADQCDTLYKKGLVTAVTILIILEQIIHIGYNMALLPITGIPMYFVSQGFTAIVTGMILVTILLVISSENISTMEKSYE